MLLLLHQPLHHDADDEALGPVVEAVDVDDVDLVQRPVEAVLGSLSLGHGADQLRHGACSCLEAAREGLRRPLSGARRNAVDEVADHVDQTLQRIDVDARVDARQTQGNVAAVGRLVLHLPFEEALHLADDEVKLARLVVRVGEEEAQHAVAAELAQGPVVGADALLPRARVRHHDVAFLRRRPEADAGERSDRQVQGGVAAVLVRRQLGVGLVQPQQVLALDVEDDGVGGVRRRAAIGEWNRP